MKKFFVILLSMFLLSPLAFATDAVLNSTVISSAAYIGSLKVNPESFYSPYPVEPGRYFDLYLRVQNPGAYITPSNYAAPLTNIKCRIDDNFPFSIDSEADRIKEVGTLSAGVDVLLKFKVRVADSAVGGLNELPFSCIHDGIDWQKIKLNVYVQARDALLTIDSIAVMPNTALAPGQEANLSFELENAANTVLRDITFKIDLSNLPFATVASTTEKRIVLLQPGERIKLSFLMKTFASAATAIYKIPVNFTYYDDLGKYYARDASTSLEVYSPPSILITLESSQINKPDSNGKVVASIINRGLTEAKFVTAYVLPSPDFELFSKSVYYLGTINPDDSNSLDLDLFVFNTSKRLVSIPLRLEYFDEVNNKHSQDASVDLRLYSSDELAKFNVEKPSDLPWIIGGIVALVLIYFVFNFLTNFVKKAKAK